MSEEIIATCNVPGVIKELCSVVKKQFNLTDEDLIVHIGHTDRLELTRVLDKELWIQVTNYCNGFLDAVDVCDYMCTEYLNDR
jgi:hypothetical protein